MIITSSLSPTLKSFFGSSTFSQEISEICTKPSSLEVPEISSPFDTFEPFVPFETSKLISTKTPNGKTAVTTPESFWPIFTFVNCFKIASRSAFFGCLWDKIRRFVPLSTSIIRAVKFLPIKSVACEDAASCEAGKKPRMPCHSQITPPRLTSIATTSISSPVSFLFSSSFQRVSCETLRIERTT